MYNQSLTCIILLSRNCCTFNMMSSMLHVHIYFGMLCAQLATSGDVFVGYNYWCKLLRCGFGCFSKIWLHTYSPIISAIKFLYFINDNYYYCCTFYQDVLHAMVCCVFYQSKLIYLYCILLFFFSYSYYCCCYFCCNQKCLSIKIFSGNAFSRKSCPPSRQFICAQVLEGNLAVTYQLFKHTAPLKLHTLTGIFKVSACISLLLHEQQGSDKTSIRQQKICYPSQNAVVSYLITRYLKLLSSHVYSSVS